MKTIARFEHYVFANIAKSKLESEGIRCFLADENLTTTYGVSSIVGYIRLQVDERDVPIATHILKTEPEVGNGNAKIIEEEEVGTEKCPNCGSRNTSVYKKASFWSLLGLFVGILLPFLKKRVYCFDCEHEWKS